MTYCYLTSQENRISHKIPVLEKRAKRAKVGGAVGLIGSKMNVLQHISNLVHQISMKLWGNVLGMKRMKTDEFGHMFAHSCPGMPII